MGGALKEILHIASLPCLMDQIQCPVPLSRSTHYPVPSHCLWSWESCSGTVNAQPLLGVFEDWGDKLLSPPHREPTLMPAGDPALSNSGHEMKEFWLCAIRDFSASSSSCSSSPPS